jgi:signal transduction histidine kinase
VRPLTNVARMREAATDERWLRACIRDLVALSTMPAWWIGLTPPGVAESLRDILLSVLRADAVFVRVCDPVSGEPCISTVTPVPGDTLSVAPGGGVSKGSANAGPTASGDGALRLASFPIGVDGELGRVAAGSKRPDFPNEHEALLMQVAASQVAVAIQHAAVLRKHERAQRLLAARAAQQAAVVRLGMPALSGTPFDRLLAGAVEVLADTLGADLCSIFERADGGEALLLRAGVGWKPGLVGTLRVSAERGSQSGYTLAVGEPVVVADFRAETRFTIHPVVRDHGIVSGMSVIIHTPGSPFGVLAAHAREPRVFTQDDVNFLQSVANVLSAALLRHRAESEREELLARTAAAHAEAEQASRAKSEFLGLMSHELRTPLNAIGGYAQIIEEGIHGPVTEEQRFDLARIRRGQQYLLSLINNVLSYLKLGAGRVRFEISDVAVDDVLATADDLSRPLMVAKKLQYVHHYAGNDVRVRADAEKLQQIVLNLLSNAAKFTDGGGSVRLDCRVEERSVSIAVHDTGVGIAADKLASVFEPFVQVGRTSTGNSQGTGLGLAISRDFARGMGGELCAESEPGKGSVFTVVLPRTVEVEA